MLPGEACATVVEAEVGLRGEQQSHRAAHPSTDTTAQPTAQPGKPPPPEAQQQSSPRGGGRPGSSNDPPPPRHHNIRQLRDALFGRPGEQNLPGTSHMGLNASHFAVPSQANPAPQQARASPEDPRTSSPPCCTSSTLLNKANRTLYRGRGQTPCERCALHSSTSQDWKGTTPATQRRPTQQEAKYPPNGAARNLVNLCPPCFPSSAGPSSHHSTQHKGSQGTQNVCDCFPYFPCYPSPLLSFPWGRAASTTHNHKPP